jgi:hypothetical protein
MTALALGFVGAILWDVAKWGASRFWDALWHE